MVVVMNLVGAVSFWDISLYVVASLAGWWSFAGLRRLPNHSKSRPSVAVVIAARNEEHNIAGVVTSVAPYLRSDDEIVVVDDHSADNTAVVAEQAGARVVQAGDLPNGWMGKPHACWAGVDATRAEVLVFIDADVRIVGAQVIDRLAANVERTPDALVSVQPWHVPVSTSERAAALFNVMAVMGSGSGRLIWRRSDALVFGPVLACRRDRYLEVGGHAHESVRGSVIEDVALGKCFGSTEVFVADARSITFRMYPHGFRSLFNGFTKNIGKGLYATHVLDAIAAAAWMSAMIGALFTSPVLYVASVVQVAIAQHRVGRFGLLVAIAYPVNAVIFVIVLLRSALVALGLGRVSWAGRQLP